MQYIVLLLTGMLVGSVSIKYIHRQLPIGRVCIILLLIVLAGIGIQIQVESFTTAMLLQVVLFVSLQILVCSLLAYFFLRKYDK